MTTDKTEASQQPEDNGAVGSQVDRGVRLLAERLREEATRRRDMLLMEAALALETKDAVILRMAAELKEALRSKEAGDLASICAPGRVPRLGDPGESVLGW